MLIFVAGSIGITRINKEIFLEYMGLLDQRNDKYKNLRLLRTSGICEQYDKKKRKGIKISESLK